MNPGETIRRKGTNQLKAQSSSYSSASNERHVEGTENVNAFRDLPPLKNLLSREVLEVICLYGALCEDKKDPQNHLSSVQALGPEEAMLQLVSEMERTLDKESHGKLEERIQLVKQCTQYPRAEWSKADTPILSIWGCLWMLEHYKAHMPKFLEWPSKDFDSYALIFASQGFGRLHHMLPSDIGLDEVSSFLSVLVSLHHRKRGTQDNNGSADLTANSNLSNPRLVKALESNCGPENQRDDPAAGGSESHCPTFQLMRALEVKHRGHAFAGPYEGTHGFHNPKLRDYSELEEHFRFLERPDHISFWVVVRKLQDFPETKTGFEDWSTEKPGDAAVHYIIKCLKTLGYQASMKTILKNPITMLAIIYYTFALKQAANDRPYVSENFLSPRFEGGIEMIPYTKQSDTGSFLQEKRGQAEDSLVLCKHEHTVAATCANLTSIGLSSMRKRVDAVNYDGVDNSPATLVRSCYLLFCAQRDSVTCNGRRTEACIECIRDTVFNDDTRHDAKWLVSKTESLLSLHPSPNQTLNERMRSCEETLKIQEFKQLQPFLHSNNCFKKVQRVVGILQFTSDYCVEEKDFSVVQENTEAQTCYAVACLSILNYSPPDDQPCSTPDVFDKIIWERDRQVQQAALKATH
jgi:hypothetical protein